LADQVWVLEAGHLVLAVSGDEYRAFGRSMIISTPQVSSSATFLADANARGVKWPSLVDY
jgi:hypothetical protein